MASPIPVLDFSSDMKALQPGSEGWDLLCKKVLKAGEKYGCFVVLYENSSANSRLEMLSGMKPLFDLPPESKVLNRSPKPYYGYVGMNEFAPYYESFGFEESQIMEMARDATELLWPDGNQGFCNALNIMSKKLVEVDHVIRSMIVDGYGVGKSENSILKNGNYIFRVQRYDPPPMDAEPTTDPDSNVTLPIHTDKSLMTILCQDGIEGLEVITKQGEWVNVPAIAGSFVVVIGDGLVSWSNNRLHAVEHRVVMGGDKERFSCGLWSLPEEGKTMEVPDELVDEEHPLRFKPYVFMDYLHYYYTQLELERTIYAFAGLVNA